MSDPPSRSDLLAGRQVALAYSAVVLTVAVGLQALPPDRHTELVLAVSTDPDGLLQHPVRSLLLRPFVVPTLTGLWLLPAVAVSVAGVEHRYGMLRAALGGMLGHAAVSTAAAVLLERDCDAPHTAAAADVGVSCVLLSGRTSTDAGRLLAWLTGLAVAGAVGRRNAQPCST